MSGRSAARVGLEAEGSSPGAERLAFHGMVGRSAEMVRVFERVRDLGPADVPVVVTGETGTGKSCCARALHRVSRVDGKFVRIDCAALSPELMRSELFGNRKGAFTGAHESHRGLLAEADGGTVLLDEIGDLPEHAQAKLLSVLEEGRYRPVGASEPVASDFRVVAATHRDLDALVAEESFRRDLRHRLGVTRIHLPPLRRRPEDVPLLAAAFARRRSPPDAGGPPGFSTEALAELSAHPWPGNVRQLEQVVARAVAPGSAGRAGREIAAREIRRILPGDVDREPDTPPLDLKAAVKRTERRTIETALACTDGRRDRAAELLGIGESTLYRKLGKWGGGASPIASDT